MYIKSILSFFFVKTLGFHLFRWLNKNQLIILCYHRITKSGDETTVSIPGNCVDEKQFDKQMNLLRTLYNPISQEQLTNYVNGKESLPEYPILVTFDDGYKDNYTNAYPILRKYKIPATIFLTTGYTNRLIIPGDDYISIAAKKTNIQKIVLSESEILHLMNNDEKRIAVKKLWDIWNSLLKKRDIKGQGKYLQQLKDMFKVDISTINNLFMTWEEIKKLNNDGMSVGAHTVKHKILSLLSSDEIVSEITESKLEIEKHLGEKIVAFAYPNGKRNDYNQKCVDILKDNSFTYAVTTELGANKLYNNTSPFELKRVCISYNDNLNMFKAKISGWILKPYLQTLLK